MQLWHDPAVRRLLHARAIQLEHEAGFFLDELERVTALDYEPTDCELSRVGQP
jgi:guanine nucleotide-binding protein subunit alpha